MTRMTRRLLALLFPALLLLSLTGWSATAAAQAVGWTQCVARSPGSGALYVGEPIDGAERAKVAQYRAEFIKAGQSSGLAAGELNAQTAFCFFAPRQADLSRMVAELGKPCPSCSAPYRQALVAWNIRDILPAEIAAAQSHLATLALSDPPPPPPPLPTATPAGAGVPPSPAEAPALPPLPERRPIASARWQTFLCGTEVRLSYAFEAPADSPVERVPFQGVVNAGAGFSRPFDQTLAKTQTAGPSCASTQFFKVADLAEFSKDMPQRGDARLTALRQRLENVALEITPLPTPAPVVAETPPSPTQKGRGAKDAKAAPNTPATPVSFAKTLPARPPIVSGMIDRTAPSARPVAPQASETATQDLNSAHLNAEISRRNAEVASRNAAAAADYEKRMAAYKAAQDTFVASQTTYERSSREHEAKVAEAARARAEWEAKVKACNAGDRAACAP